jgi:hypothetical protein
MNHPQRKIIPDALCMVVLDTSPARNIAHASDTPAWVATFAEMSKAGYSFSLADGAVTELLSQYLRGSITKPEHARMVQAIESFLSPDLPILPGKQDLMGMIGESTDPAWSEAELVAFSRHALNVLGNPSLLSEKERARIEPALQYDRKEWTESFAKYDARYTEWLLKEPDGEKKLPLNEHDHPLLEDELADLASYSRTQPPTLAERSDLQLRYIFRQWVRTRQKKDSYDPTNPKKINDGIDLDIYRYLMLPALVVADDRGFHERLADIKSPQRHWFWRPQELADAWTRGERPRPAWAAPVIDQADSPAAG